MKFIQYTCELLTDVVMVSRAATEGFHESLTYIPGSKFLGIVASELYPKTPPKELLEQQKLLDLFHNGCVQFGDAHPVYENTRLLLAPLTWERHKYEPKAKRTTKIFFQKDTSLSYEKGGQVQQVKKDNFNDKHYFLPPTYQIGKVTQVFSLKSAYDPSLRRSEDSQMFGYYALARGMKFGFSVGYKNEAYIAEIEKALLGRKGIGRSKTAEYGQVNIQKISFDAAHSNDVDTAPKYRLYAESNWCFYDQQGKNSTQITATDLGFPAGSKAKIDWTNSKVRHRAYRTWNAHRKNRDTDRMIIKKGSVLSLDVSAVADSELAAWLEKTKSGIGAHLNEGFGRVLVNPNFQLLATRDNSYVNVGNEGKNLDLKPKKKVKYLASNNPLADNAIFGLLERRAKHLKERSTTIAAVAQFWNEKARLFKSISKTQWGLVRSHADTSATDKVLMQRLFDKEEGLLYRGQSQEAWKKQECRKKLEEQCIRYQKTGGSARKFIHHLGTIAALKS